MEEKLLPDKKNWNKKWKVMVGEVKSENEEGEEENRFSRLR